MRLTAILAVSRDGALGSTTSPTGMPWPRLQRDLRRFREATMGKVVLTGRKTYETLPPRGLPGRRIAVLTRNAAWSAGHPPGDPRCVRVLGPLDGVLPLLRREEEVMVIGGAEVYRAMLPRCDRLLLTTVERDYPDADVRLDRPGALTDGLVCLAREYHAPDESNPVGVTFSEWVRPLATGAASCRCGGMTYLLWPTPDVCLALRFEGGYIFLSALVFQGLALGEEPPCQPG